MQPELYLVSRAVLRVDPGVTMVWSLVESMQPPQVLLPLLVRVAEQVVVSPLLDELTLQVMALPKVLLGLFEGIQLSEVKTAAPPVQPVHELELGLARFERMLRLLVSKSGI